jgi:DNA repair exonuclease SbcCD ATPase subunit
MWPLVLFLSVLCIGNSVAVYLLWRKKQHLEMLQTKQEKQIEQQSAALKSLSRRLETYLDGSMRMGEELQELQKDLAPLPDKILRMEQRDPSSLSFTQAARLVGLGASAEDLKQSCGLSQSEAELLQRMHSKKSP